MRTLHCSFAVLLLAGAGMSAAAPDTRVVDAAERNDAQAVIALVKQGADVNIAQGDGGTALHWAAHWDDLAMARRLIAAGAHVDSANDYGVTPLFLAATNGNPEMIGVLLDAGANPNAALPSGETVLMAAVRGGNSQAVRRLLAKHANPNAIQASKKQTALMWTATAGNVEVAKALIEAGADVNAKSGTGFTPLMFASREGHVEVAKALLTGSADLNGAADDGSTPLLVATVRGHADLALYFLEHGATPDGNRQAGYTPLHWAVGDYEISPITYTDIEAPGEWAALTGIPDRQKKFALVTALLANGADVNAITTKPLPAMSPLNGGGAITPHVGVTPFFTAASSADAEMMRFLLANGADASIRARDGYTPLMAACEGLVENALRLNEDRRLRAVEVAIAAGNDLEAQDTKGWHPMHVAARGGFHRILKSLIDHGADMNSLTKPTAGGLGGSGYQVDAQSPRGLVEGTIVSIFYERPETATYLASLGAKSIGKFNQNEYDLKKAKAAASASPTQAQAPPPAVK
jgi:ankyrin repeat protein